MIDLRVTFPQLPPEGKIEVLLGALIQVLWDLHSNNNPTQVPAWVAQLTARLGALEDHLSQQDDKIDAFVAQTQANFAAVGTALDNIVADEASLAKQIADLQAAINTDPSSDLSEATAAKLQALVESSAQMAARTQGIADSIPDAPPPPTV